MTDQRLLIIEDDPGLATQMRWCFEGLEVSVVDNARDAEALLRKEEPQVVTLDLGLPPDPGGTRRSPRWVDGGCNEGGLTATPRKINPETLNRCGPSQTTGGSMPEHWGGPKQNNQQRKHETHSTCHCAGHHRGGAQFHGSGPTSAGRWSSWWRASRRSGRSWG